MRNLRTFTFVALAGVALPACAQNAATQSHYIETDGRSIAATGDEQTDAFLMSINQRHKGNGR